MRQSRSGRGLTSFGLVAALGAFTADAVYAQTGTGTGTGTGGRFVPLGITGVAKGWKARHPSDEHFIYSLDSATGQIDICGDTGGICRSIAESEREARGTAVNRFVGLGITDVTKAWKSRHPLDAHLVYSMDTATGQIQICGDTGDVCASLSNRSVIATAQPPKIVILYRRADSAAIAGRIYDRLIAHYGEGSVFMDIYSIPFAADWTERVKRASVNGQILLSLIGPNWLGRTTDGHVRINDEDDPVRVELETAFQAHVPVFPVLVEGASMPKSTELPASLRSFSSINAATVDIGRDFDAHMARLLRAMDQSLANPSAASP